MTHATANLAYKNQTAAIWIFQKEFLSRSHITYVAS